MIYLVISVVALVVLFAIFTWLESVWYNRRCAASPLESIMDDDDPIAPQEG